MSVHLYLLLLLLPIVQVFISPLKAAMLWWCRYTVLFAVARTVGWVAQWKEMAEEPLQKISRPRQVSWLHINQHVLLHLHIMNVQQ